MHCVDLQQHDWKKTVIHDYDRAWVSCGCFLTPWQALFHLSHMTGECCHHSAATVILLHARF